MIKRCNTCKRECKNTKENIYKMENFEIYCTGYTMKHSWDYENYPLNIKR